jgi:hypothetical protein
MKVELDYNRSDKATLQESLKRLEEENHILVAKHSKTIDEVKSWVLYLQ